jgi:uridine kinase
VILLENKLFLEKMDFVIELQVDRDEVIKRKVERDNDVRTREQTNDMHMRAQAYFWDRNKPKNPNIIIDNNDFRNPRILAQQ